MEKHDGWLIQTFWTMFPEETYGVQATKEVALKRC